MPSATPVRVVDASALGALLFGEPEGSAEAIISNLGLRERMAIDRVEVDTAGVVRLAVRPRGESASAGHAVPGALMDAKASARCARQCARSRDPD